MLHWCCGRAVCTAACVRAPEGPPLRQSLGAVAHMAGAALGLITRGMEMGSIPIGSTEDRLKILGRNLFGSGCVPALIDVERFDGLGVILGEP